MSENLVKKWLVVQIKPNSDSLAFRNLQRQSFEIFIPKMRVTKKKSNKFIYKDVPVFPGYMFIGINRQNSNWMKINSTYGVSKVLVFNKKPYEISSDLILALKKKYELNISPTIKGDLEKGDNIKFNSGPFVDLFAKIEAIDDKSRIWVILETSGNYNKIKIQPTEKINFTKL